MRKRWIEGAVVSAFCRSFEGVLVRDDREHDEW